MQPTRSGSARVLAFGSSVSGAFDPHQVEGLLQAHQRLPRAEVRRLTMPGIRPSEFLLLFESEETPRPDITVILFNLADFLYPAPENEVNRMLFYTVPPIALCERATARDRGPARLGLSQLSNLYRYRKPIRACIRNHEAPALALRPSPPTLGHHADGHAERRFALNCQARAAAPSISSIPNGSPNAAVRWSSAAMDAARHRIEAKAGWKSWSSAAIDTGTRRSERRRAGIHGREGRRTTCGCSV
jgi:hypothetical protein